MEKRDLYLLLIEACRFLLISLTMDAILGQTTDYGRRRKLRAMTEGLDLKNFYGATIERIKEQGGERARLGMAALMWISHSERLLQLDELLHALAVEIGSTDLNAENIPSVETLLSCCLGLVAVDREASTIRLIHFSLQEYLNAFPDIFGPTHSIMAETCLTYLHFQVIKDIPPTYRYPDLPPATPFLIYASIYWGVHARRETSTGVISLALQLFSQIETHISTRLLLEDIRQRSDWHYDRPPLIEFTGLHCASVFGIAEIATSLMDQPNCNLNKRDCLGVTPLIWAATCGQEEVAKMLLERQTVNPDMPDKYPGRTALSWAAVMGHEGIVKLLLERASANPDGTDGWWGKTPRAVKKVWRRKYVNPNRPDKFGKTPILLAATEGHESVVKLLLGRKDVKPNIPDQWGLTPLLWAAENGHGGVVKLLLERQDVNPDMPNSFGRTPLSSAAERGRDGVVKLLLGREDVNPDMPDDDGRTPLSWAAEHGHDGAVELLLGWEGVKPDMPDNGGRTPLSWAAKKGRDGVVKLLLGREGVNPDIPDIDGRTPLSWAAWKGHNQVVKLLLEREDVSPDMPDNGGRTPLSWAVEGGDDGVVKLLLEQADVNPNMSDNDGRTPLSWAAKWERDAVVRLLLRWEGISPDMPDNGGRTPLSWAAGRGDSGASVGELLGREGIINPNLPVKNYYRMGPVYSQSPLRGRHYEIVKLLLGREDVNPGMPDNCGQTPLSWATWRGHHRAVELLLGRGDVSLNMPDNRGQTPLSLAASNGHDGVVKLLLEQEDVNPDFPDNNGRTPLS